MPQDDRSELTFHAIALGIILSVVMGAANVYLGLKVGMTVSASIPAAVIATGILRGVFRRKGVLEANMVQTAASAGESIAAGVIFTIPALLIAGVWGSFDANYWTITLIAFAGGMLGILFMIPMRRVFVVESPELIYPEGKACAEVLRAGSSEENVGAARAGLRIIMTGLGIGAFFEILAGLLGVLAKQVTYAYVAGTRAFYAGCGMSPMLIGVGVIVGLPIAIQVFMGGAIGWLVALPLLEATPEVLQSCYADLPDTVRNSLTLEAAMQSPPQAMADAVAWTLWSAQVRYLGVGAMVVGGLVSLWQVRHGLKAAVTELVGQFRPGTTDGSKDAANRDLAGPTILSLLGISVVVIAALYFTLLENDIPITMLTTAMMVVMAFFFTAVASYIVGLVGGSNSPVSGMTIMALLSTGILIYLLGYSGQQAVLATLGVAGVVCCAACTSGDVCNDLKTGHLVGASPRSQQIMQVIAVVVAVLVMAPILQALHDGSIASKGEKLGGIGTDAELPAPQARLMASLAQTFFSVESEGGAMTAGDDAKPFVFESGMLAPNRWGEIPPKPRMMGLGAVLGVIFLATSFLIRRLGFDYRLHVMPIAVGIYLPFYTVVALVLGGILGVFINRLNRPGHDATGQGVLAASGLIAGEAIAGIGVALFKGLKIDVSIPTAGYLKYAFAIVFLLLVCMWIYRASKARGLTDTNGTPAAS